MDFQSVNATATWLRQIGPAGPTVAILLFYMQSVLPIFPFPILAGAAGLVYGVWWGTLIAWVGSTCGTVTLYWLARLGRWRRLKKWFANRTRFELTEIPPHIAFITILIGRAIPVVPAQAISAGAGISRVNFWLFLIASVIGKLPLILFFVGLGDYLVKTGDWAGTIAMFAGVLLLLWGLTWYWRHRKRKRRAARRKALETREESEKKE
ncbi:MAG: TVP38/TMEM64 family protein [Solirubrobacterales bacterium]